MHPSSLLSLCLFIALLPLICLLSMYYCPLTATMCRRVSLPVWQPYLTAGQTSSTDAAASEAALFNVFYDNGSSFQDGASLLLGSGWKNQSSWSWFELTAALKSQSKKKKKEKEILPGNLVFFFFSSWKLNRGTNHLWNSQGLLGGRTDLTGAHEWSRMKSMRRHQNKRGCSDTLQKKKKISITEKWIQGLNIFADMKNYQHKHWL